MQITCDKCSTTYALDERLLPPGGAPVQCTRCGHVFLATPASEARPLSSTQIFGAGQMPGGFEDEPEVKTKIFGEKRPGAPAPPPEPPRPSTQMFGAVKAPQPEAPRPSTQMFGSVKVPPHPEPPPTSTQVFGSVKVPSQPAPLPTATQIFGAEELPPQPAPPPTATQMFGAAELPPQPEPPRTHTRGMFEAPASTLSREPPTSPDLRKSDVFSAAVPPTEPHGTPLPKVMVGGAAQEEEGAGAAKKVDSATATTLQMTTGDVRRALASRQRAGAPQQVDAQSAPTPAAGLSKVPSLPPEPKTEGSASPFEPPTESAVPAIEEPPPRYAKVELPPEVDVQELPGLPSPRSRSARPAAAAPKPPGKLRWILVALAVLIAAGGGLYGYRALDRRLTAVPPEVIAQREEANVLLRRDDPESRQRAIAQLERLLRYHPAYLDAEADLVVALALDVDDARAEGEAFEAQAQSLEAKIAKLTELQSPSDWQNRVNAMAEQVRVLREGVRPFETQRASSLQKMEAEQEILARAEAKLGELPPATAALLARARALSFAVKGSGEAIASADRYRALGGGGGWAEIAQAELALNSDASREGLGRSAAELERAIAEDGAFIRPRVLRARLADRQGDFEAASSALEVVLALNPNHPVARALRDRAEAALRQQSDAEQPPVPPDSMP